MHFITLETKVYEGSKGTIKKPIVTNVAEIRTFKPGASGGVEVHIKDGSKIDIDDSFSSFCIRMSNAGATITK